LLVWSAITGVPTLPALEAEAEKCIEVLRFQDFKLQYAGEDLDQVKGM
jgi:hypothetical protein